MGRGILWLAAGLACCLACAAAQESTIYMAVLSSRSHQWNSADNPVIGLFTSTDRGASWQHIGWREYIRTFYSVESVDGTLWTACGNGVLRSTDGGTSWKVTTGWEETEVLKIAVDPRRPERVFAATAYGPIATTDGGETWEFRRNGLSRWFTGDVCIDWKQSARVLLASETGVLISVDGGRRWRPTSLKGKDIRTIVQDPSADGRFWAGTEQDGIWASANGGATWHSASKGLSHMTVYCIVFDPDDPVRMYAGTHGGGVYRSSDHGRTWQQCSQGLLNLVVHSLAVLPGGPPTVFAGTLNDGLFRSTDGGDTWTFNSQPEAQVWGLSTGKGIRERAR